MPWPAVIHSRLFFSVGLGRVVEVGHDWYKGGHGDDKVNDIEESSQV